MPHRCPNESTAVVEVCGNLGADRPGLHMDGLRICDSTSKERGAHSRVSFSGPNSLSTLFAKDRGFGPCNCLPTVSLTLDGKDAFVNGFSGTVPNGHSDESGEFDSGDEVDDALFARLLNLHHGYQVAVIKRPHTPCFFNYLGKFCGAQWIKWVGEGTHGATMSDLLSEYQEKDLDVGNAPSLRLAIGVLYASHEGCC